MVKTKTRTNNYQLITNKLIELLEKGVKPWKKPWQANSFGNLIGGNKYQGCNPFFCQMDLLYYGYSSTYFISFNQAKEKNWKIKKGSKATTLTYAGSFEIETEKGEKETRYHKKFYKVFNLDCVDDSTAEIKIADLVQAAAPPVNPDSEIVNLKTFCQSHNVPILHGGDRACYSPSLDRISMPEFKYFSSANAYYSTLLHELSHSSGHEKRLNRDLSGAFGSTKYAREELIAEISSVFLASKLGIKQELELENHASYLASWIKVLKEDPKALFAALSQATAASEYLLRNSQENL